MGARRLESRLTAASAGCLKVKTRLRYPDRVIDRQGPLADNWSMAKSDALQQIKELIDQAEDSRFFVVAGVRLVEHASECLRGRGLSPLPQALEILVCGKRLLAGDLSAAQAAERALKQVRQLAGYDAVTSHCIACYDLARLLKYYAEYRVSPLPGRLCWIATYARDAVSYAKSEEGRPAAFAASGKKEGAWQIRHLEALLSGEPPSDGPRLRNSLLASRI